MRTEALVTARANSLARGSLMLGSDVGITDDELRALLAHPGVPALTMLHVFDGKLGPEGVRAIVASEKTRGLDDLRLGSTPIGDEGLAIAAAGLPSVTKLSAPEVGATARGAEAVAAGAWRLTRLELGHQQVGDDGARALAALALEHLLVQQAGIGGDGARALIEAPIANLKLEGNALGGGLRGLARIASTTLDLSKAGLTDADAEALAAVDAPALVALDLGYNAFGAAGVAALERAPWRARLRSLDVTGA